MLIQNRGHSVQGKGRICAAHHHLMNSHPSLGWHQKGCNLSSVAGPDGTHVAYTEGHLPVSSFYGASETKAGEPATIELHMLDRDQAIPEGVNNWTKLRSYSQ